MGDASQNEKGSPVKSNDDNNDLNPREEQVWSFSNAPMLF